MSLLASLDIKLEGVKDDTLIAAYLLDPNRSKYELTDLAREAVGVDGFGHEPEGWTDLLWQTAATADLTAQTAHVLHERILEKKLETIYSEIELPLAPLAVSGRPAHRLLNYLPGRYYLWPLLIFGVLAWVWKIFIHVTGRDGWG